MFLSLLLPCSSGLLFFLQVGCLRRASGLLCGCRPFLRGLIFYRAVTGLLGRAAAFRQVIRLCVAAFLLCRLLFRACCRAPTPSAVGPRPRRRSGPDPAGGRAPTASPVGPRPRRRSGHDALGGRPVNGSNLLVVCSCRRVFAACFCLGPVTGPG